MKYIITFISFLLATLVLSAYTLVKSDTPEKLIGKWEEVSSEYEIVTKHDSTSEGLTKEQMSEICSDLVIHQAEYWHFVNTNTLNLHKPNDANEDVVWNIKGRGNILELQHSDAVSEDYQIVQLDDDNLVIHLSFDLQIKGIVKMTFKKVKEDYYATKL